MKNSFYFPHDNNARNDDRLLMLRSKFGNFEGYALFFWFLESMASTSDGYLIRGALGGLSISYGVPIERLNEFVEYGLNVGLFKEQGDVIFSERMREHMLMRMSFSDGGIKGAKKRWGKRKPPNAPLIKAPNAKERIGEERKEKTIVETTPQADKPLTDLQKIVLCYKMVSGYPKEDKAWDKLNFARCSKSAKQLLDFLGNWRDAADCIEDIYDKFTAKGLTVTIETAVKHASEWKMNQSEQKEKVYDNAGSL